MMGRNSASFGTGVGQRSLGITLRLSPGYPAKSRRVKVRTLRYKPSELLRSARAPLAYPGK